MTTDTAEPITVPIGVEEIRQAAERLARWVHRTPVMTSKALDDRCGASVFLKCENLQKIGAFKFRGAMNAVLQLSDRERQAGVITHSSGNHAQAVALAGKLLGAPVTVVMPRTSPAVKRVATQGYGARIVLCEPTFNSREETTASEIARHGFTLVHPFNDWNVIAGQATAAWELMHDVPALDLVICPVGGGGLLAGTVLAVKGRAEQTQVMAAEPANADDARRSLESGEIQYCENPNTIADGLRTTSIGPRNFAVIRDGVDRIVAVSETDIVDAMRFVWERIKILIEPSSAVAVAPLLNGTIGANGRKVGVILSGGNVDLEPMFQEMKSKLG
jgi:threonine dehydratase